MDQNSGDSICGPSLILVPGWIENPLGKYYLYFAHHNGGYIRMAYSDHLEGPWTIHGPGVLGLSASFFNHHIASPDVHVVDERKEIRMYYHGCCSEEVVHQLFRQSFQVRLRRLYRRLRGRREKYQYTRLATSNDGLNFQADQQILGLSYWRVFRYQEYWYTLEMPGRFRRSKTGVSGFEEGPVLFTPSMRHSAVLLKDDVLTVFYTNIGDSPERILTATIRLTPDWFSWEVECQETLMAPSEEYEGAECPVQPSVSGGVYNQVHQLRDPCIFEYEEQTYLLYAVAGESGIAIAELRDKSG